MKIMISTDSTCDLSAELIQMNDIGIVPLTIIIDGNTRMDGVNIHPQDIFDWVDAGGEICKTTAPSPAEYEEIFRGYLKDHDAVIHINIGSGFSASWQNARLASEQLENVYAFDSENLSTGQGHLVIEAAKLCKKGLSPPEILAELTQLRGRVESSFILCRLDYLVKGGRCSAAAAFGANMLKLKPCIEVIGNKMISKRKYRGSYSQCLRDYIKERLAGRDDIVNERLFLTYTPCSDSDLQAAREAVAEHAMFSEIFETSAGCTISCHCGPQTLGVLFIRK